MSSSAVGQRRACAGSEGCSVLGELEEDSVDDGMSGSLSTRVQVYRFGLKSHTPQ